ncbi:MAG TPA: alpha/beta hydrolase [Actinocatenispora sp.]
MSAYATGRVESADGTTIGFRRLGSGPAVVLVHGGMLAAQNLMTLATILSDEFEVFVPDRRGRGPSGPHGDRYGVAREVEDLQALVAASGAARIFGLSSGGLASLRTALETPALRRVALYEPPLAVRGSAPVDWVRRYDREIDAGDPISALVTAMRGLGTEPVMGRVPRFALTAAFRLGMRFQSTAADEVPIIDLVPTEHYDMQLVREMADTADDYAALSADVLLLSGARSPGYLTTALDELARVLPHHRRVTFPGLRHDGPENDGDPARVAVELRTFFR